MHGSLFVFFLKFFYHIASSSLASSPCSSSTLLGLEYPLGHCNLHNGAGTVLLLYYTSVRHDYVCFTMWPSRHSSFLLYPWFYDAVSVPSSCTSTIVSSFQHLPLLSCSVSVCIHPCVFPILSRAVVLLYMGLTLAIAARVGHHYTILPCYDDVP